jgi:hypothetical protein
MIVYPDDTGKDLDAVLTGMVGRRLTVAEIHSALEMPYTTYDAQRKQGRLVSCANLVKAARNLGINEIELLLRYRVISPEAFERYAREVFTLPSAPLTEFVDAPKSDAEAIDGSPASPQPKTQPLQGSGPEL